jgi:DNA polymerase-3 subunit delta'
VIPLPDQPLAQRILGGALSHARVPQQFLFFGPRGTGKRAAADALAHVLIGGPGSDRSRASLDLSVVRASGDQIRLEELEDALRDLATRPVVGRARVAVIEDAHRLRNDAGDRILKPLEEPPPSSYLILVTERPDDLLPTIRSRCMPVPFRSPGWRAIRGRLVDAGVPPEQAEALARSDGPMALASDGFWRAMREVGAQMGLEILRGGRDGSLVVGDAQRRMEAQAAGHASDELRAMRAAAEELEGRRGGKTALKRADDQAKRERRRMLSDGWAAVLGGAAAVVADALALAVGAGDRVRHRTLLEEIRAAGAPADLCERALEEIELTRAELQLNPTVDVAVQAMLIRIGLARRGEQHPLTAPGRLPW